MIRLLLAACFSGVFSTSFAQFTWGFKAGANASTVRVRDVHIVYNVLPGYNFGLFAEKAITRRLGLLTDLSFSTQGTSLGGGRAFHLNYVSIPLLAAFNIDKKWQLVLGPEAGYLVRAYQHNPGPYGGNSDYLSYFHRFDWGLAGGVRYKSRNHWGFDLRYVYGIGEIQRPPYNQYGGDVIVIPPYSPKNTLLQLDVFFAIR